MGRSGLVVTQHEHTCGNQTVLFDLSSLTDGLSPELVAAAMEISVDDEIEAALAGISELGELVESQLTNLGRDHNE